MNAAEYAHKQGLQLYVPTVQNDYTMLRWYLLMQESNQFLTVFEPSLAMLSNFMKFLQFPTNLLFYTQDRDLLYAFWMRPIGQGKALIGFWSDKEFSKTKLFRLLRASHAYAFTFYTVLFGFTQSEKLLSYVNKLGYNLTDAIPNAWDGIEPATLMSLTRDAYEKSGLKPQGYATRTPKGGD